VIEITRKSPFSGKTNTMLLACTQEEYDQASEAYVRGALLQEAFHFLNADEREFVKTGITPSEWRAVFGEEDA